MFTDIDPAGGLDPITDVAQRKLAPSPPVTATRRSSSTADRATCTGSPKVARRLGDAEVGGGLDPGIEASTIGEVVDRQDAGCLRSS